MTGIVNVRRRPTGVVHEGLLEAGGTVYPCSLGRSGITTTKREGDGATPAGEFRLLYGYFRADRMMRLPSLLELTPIAENAGWCDEPGHAAYNSAVTLPFDYSHEKMMRDDRLYDVCIVLDFNIHPRARGMGSAIFFHQTRPGGGPTEGCVAIEPHVMRKLLPSFSPSTTMRVHI